MNRVLAFILVLMLFLLSLLPTIAHGQDTATTLYLPYLDTQVERGNWFTHAELVTLQERLGYDETEAIFQTWCEVVSLGATQAEIRYSQCVQDDETYVLIYLYDSPNDFLTVYYAALSVSDEPLPINPVQAAVVP